MKKLITLLFLASCLIGMAQLKGDGITDNSVVFDSLIKKGGQIYLPYGRIMIKTGVQYKNVFIKDWTNPTDKSINAAPYQNAKFSAPFEIIGHPLGTVIWLDNPDTTMAVLALNAQGLQYDNWVIKISNVTLMGKGVGISSAYTKDLQLDNVRFKGLTDGILFNNVYRAQCNNLFFENCKRAEYDIRSHNTEFRNIKVYDCNKGFEVRSNKIGIYGYTAIRCYTGLHVVGSVNTFDRIVLETNKPTPQLVIGDTSGLSIDGNTFINLTISAPNMKAIRFEKTCGFLTIIGGQIQSTNFEIIGKPVVDQRNLLGTLPKEILKQ